LSYYDLKLIMNREHEIIRPSYCKGVQCLDHRGKFSLHSNGKVLFTTVNLDIDVTISDELKKLFD